MNDESSIDISKCVRELTELRDLCAVKSGMATKTTGLDGTTEGGIGVSESNNTVVGQGDKSLVERLARDNCNLHYAQRVHELFRKSAGTYVSDVLSYGSQEAAERACQTLEIESGLSYKRGLLLISLHDTHVHVVHDCNFSNKTCRCAWLQKAEILHGQSRRGRSLRRRRFCNELSVSDIQNIFTYFSENGRRTTYIRIAGRVEAVPIQHQDMEIGGPEGCGSERSLEAQYEMDDDELRRFTPENHESIERDRRGRQAIHEKKSNKYTKKGQKMLNMMKNLPMVPVQSILNHPSWLKDEQLCLLNAEDKLVKAVINNWTKQLCTWSIYDFHALYESVECNPIFSAGYGNVENYYYDVETSLDELITLLNYQFHNDGEIILKFVTDLFNILERRTPKLNSMLIRSPPSGGKNYFFDCITNYYLNIGHLCRANKHNNFAFQDAEGRRVIMWNEPNYSREYTDLLKELLGGDSTNITVKYKAECPIYRTPVILLTNSVLDLEGNIAFKDRLACYHWSPAYYLKERNKKPNPLATYLLFKHFGLIKDLKI